VTISLLLSLCGLFLLVSRLTQFGSFRTSSGNTATKNLKVSIIVPARNEAAVIADLLHSIKQIDYAHLETIVVDDCSNDGTADIALDFGVKVIAGQPRPEGWNGKQWACHQGARAASGDVLIFTDADTQHERDSVRRLVNYMENNSLDVASALPFHIGDKWWEQLSGPFHLLLMMVTAPFWTPKVKRVWCVGQYLAFRRQAYDLLGGHEAVKQSWVEDVPMANRALAKGFRYGVYGETHLHRVRMYNSLPAFIAGWRRNFRAGMTESSPLAPLQIGAVFAALTCGGFSEVGFWSILIAFASMAYIYWRQPRFGDFSPLGAMFFPFGVGLFCVATMLSLWDMVTGNEAKWKGRVFSKT